jgi:hypothetical protein
MTIVRSTCVFAAALTVAGLAGAGLSARQAPAAPAQEPPRTLAVPHGDALPVDSQGFLRRWLVLEPIPVRGALTEDAVHDVVAANDVWAGASALPADGQTATIAGQSYTWHGVDTLAYNLNLFHFAYGRGKPTSNVLFWTTTIVNAPRAMADVRLAIGSNAASAWWLNGRHVIALYNDRQAVIDDGVSPRVTLQAGANVIRAAIVNAGGATDFCARFLDADDEPITTLTACLAPAEGVSR